MTIVSPRPPAEKRADSKPRPQVVVTLLLLAAAFPVRLAVGPTTVSLFDLALIAALMPFIMVAGAKTIPSTPRPFIALGAISTTLSLLSLGWSKDAGATALYVVSNLEAVLIFFLVVTFLRDAPAAQIAKLISIYVVALLVPAALLWARVPGFLPPATIDPLSGDYLSYFVRLSHPFIGRSNNLAALLVVFVVPLGVWAIRTRHRYAALTSILALGAIVLTFSRGTYVALIASVVVYALIDSRAVRRILARAILPAVVILAIVGLTIATNDATGTYIGDRLSSAGVESRQQLIYQAAQIFTSNSVVGTGAGTGDDVHNTFLQQFVYFGLYGGAVVCVLLLWVGGTWLRRTGPTSWLAKAIGAGMVAQLISFAAESSYEGTLLRPLIWLGWGLLVAFFRAESNDETRPRDTKKASRGRVIFAKQF